LAETTPWAFKLNSPSLRSYIPRSGATEKSQATGTHLANAGSPK
jgi:hypothetical protein